MTAQQQAAAPLVVGSLFSGVGGFEIGFEAAGFRTAWQCEIDHDATSVLERHWPNVRRFRDVREMTALRLDMTYNPAMKKMPLLKLTQDQVDAAIVAYDAGDSLGTIAKRCGVSRQSMWELLRRRTAMRPQKKEGSDNHFYRGGASVYGRAHDITEYAIATGKLIRPDVCEACGGIGQPYKDGRAPIQAHHCDYNKPLDVMWLCKGCHHDWHRRFRPIPVEGGDASGSRRRSRASRRDRRRLPVSRASRSAWREIVGARMTSGISSLRFCGS
jgi:C-5 cytosine-specific DNA methylase